MRGHQHGQRQGRQRRDIDALAETHVRKHGRQRGEPAELDGEEEDEQIADEEFRHRDRDQRDDVGEPVDPLAFVDGREDAEADRQRHRDQRGIAGQEQRVLEFRRDRGQDVALVGQRLAEIAVQGAEEPVEIADIGRLIEAEFVAEHRQRVRRAPWPSTAVATSPGRICVAAKIRTETASSVSRPRTTRVSNQSKHRVAPATG